MLVVADTDSARMEHLRVHGQRIDGRQLSVLFPPDSLPEQHVRALIDSLDIDVVAAEKLIGGPHPWQRNAGRRIIMYFNPGKFISHANGCGRRKPPLQQSSIATRKTRRRCFRRYSERRASRFCAALRGACTHPGLWDRL